MASTADREVSLWVKRLVVRIPPSAVGALTPRRTISQDTLAWGGAGGGFRLSQE